MSIRVEVTGVGKLRKKFADKRRKATDVSYDVGYTANYAFWVHEMEPADPQWGRLRQGENAKGDYWDPAQRGGPKFLETPAREGKSTFVKIIQKTVTNGGTLDQGVKLAALLLQRNSQDVVPVDTGNLKASAFTRKTK